jgi:hypothetical protein
MSAPTSVKGQITTASFFKVTGASNQWWAFKQMQLGLEKLKSVQGLSFYKIFGSGADNGFSAWPNFSTYVLLTVWDSEVEAEDFFRNDPFFLEYREKSKESFTVYSQSAEAHGLWDGTNPFVQQTKVSPTQPVMVLTRARIRFSKLLSFWSRVNQVSKSLMDYEGARFSIGVGEWPLIQQATLSLWCSQKEMLDYAYKNKKHKAVIQLTRKLNWYSEEMFARFLPYRISGKWEGKEMSELLN